jgi:hypothetical protein
MTIRRRRWERKHPKPAPPPDGFMWATRWERDDFGRVRFSTELVKAEEFANYCKEQIGILDELTPQERQRVYETGEVPTREVSQINRGIAGVGIALARTK